MSTAPQTRPSAVMSLLEQGVPLSLLLDLAWGPCSRELLDTERPDVSAPQPPAA